MLPPALGGSGLASDLAGALDGIYVDHCLTREPSADRAATDPRTRVWGPLYGGPTRAQPTRTLSRISL